MTALKPLREAVPSLASVDTRRSGTTAGPFATELNPVTGTVNPEASTTIRTLSGMADLFADRSLVNRTLAALDPIVYRTSTAPMVEAEGHLGFNQTRIESGTVGDEFFMTHGHIHIRPEAEAYIGQSGTGGILLSRDGDIRWLPMRPGVLGYIPPGWLHRSVNTGNGPFVFISVFPALSGQNYEPVRHHGLGARVRRHGAGHTVLADTGETVYRTPQPNNESRRAVMQAVVYDAPQSFQILEQPDRGLLAGEVRLRVLASGICGTDQHIHDGGFGVRFPVTPGHEIIGEIAEHGPGGGKLQLGARVAVDNVTTCGHCSQCQDGRSGLCENLEALGLTHPGSAAEYVIAPEDQCIPVGDLELDIAILAEPTACVVHGLDVLQLKPGSDVLIIGAGPTGQILSQLIARGGASRVSVAAPTQFKLDVAKRNGATETLLTARADFAASIPALRRIAPTGFDVVIDATGATEVLQQGLSLVRDGGTLMVYGMAGEDAQIHVNPYEIFRRELTIKGAFSQTNCVARAVKLLQGGKVVTDGIITHWFALDRYGDALNALHDPACLKAILIPALTARSTQP